MGGRAAGRRVFQPWLDSQALKKEQGSPSPFRLPRLALPEGRVLLEQESRTGNEAGWLIELMPAPLCERQWLSAPPSLSCQELSQDTFREASWATSKRLIWVFSSLNFSFPLPPLQSSHPTLNKVTSPAPFLPFS